MQVGQAARCVRVALKTRDLDWLPFVDAFMNFLPHSHSRGSGPAAWDKAVRIANLPPGRLTRGLAAMTIRAYVRASTADQRCELQGRDSASMPNVRGGRLPISTRM